MPCCAVVICKNRSETSNFKTNRITFHRFPRDSTIKQEWISATNRGPNWFPLDRSTICSAHFEEKCFKPLKNSRRLFDGAVPTLRLRLIFANATCTESIVNTCNTGNSKNSIDLNTENIPANEAKEIIAKVYHRMKYEALNGVEKLTDARWRTSQAVGVSQSTITRVLKQERQDTIHKDRTQKLLKSPSKPKRSGEEDPSCDVCHRNILKRGVFVFTCLQCPDVHLCKTCFNDGHHSHHYVVRIPKDQPPKEVTEVIFSLRAQFIPDAAIKSQTPKVDAVKPTILKPRPDEEAISVKIERDAEADPLQSHVVPGSSNLEIKCEKTYYNEYNLGTVSIKLEPEMYEVEVDNYEESIIRAGEPQTVQHHGTCKSPEETYSHKKRGLSDDGAEAGPSSKLKCYSGTKVKVEPLSEEESSGDSQVRDAASGSHESCMSMVLNDNRASTQHIFL